MWRDLIASLAPAAAFAGSATDRALREAEESLCQPIPPALGSLLCETNGVADEYGCALVWDLDRIVADNLAFRQNEAFSRLYMPFDPLLFFADAGNGDQFALLSPPVGRDDVFAWDHHDDSRTWVAAGVELFLRGWLGGTISL